MRNICAAYAAGETFISKKIREYHKKNITVLDVGCGTGQTAVNLLKSNGKKCQVYGVDLLDQKDVDKSVRYKKLDLEDVTLPYRDSQFDIVFSNQVIEHILNKDRLIQECYRVLVHGGLCIFSTENIASLDNIASLILGQEPLAQNSSFTYHINSIISPHYMQKDYNGHVAHKNVCSYFSIIRLFRICGFKKVNIQSYGHLNGFLERLLPFQNRVIIAYAIK